MRRDGHLVDDLPCPECGADVGWNCRQANGKPALCCPGRLRAWSETRPPLDIKPGPGPEAVIPEPSNLFSTKPLKGECEGTIS